MATAIADAISSRAANSGDFCSSARTSKTGWLICGGASIGKVGSGANSESADYAALFEVVKGLYPNLGTEVFASGDVVFLPDLRGRAFVGRDDMGGTTASRMTVAGSGINGTILGSSGGAETVSLTAANNGAHSHTTYASHSTNNPTTGGATRLNNLNGGGPNTGTTSTEGSGTAHQNTQPSFVANIFIKI